MSQRCSFQAKNTKRLAILSQVLTGVWSCTSSLFLFEAISAYSPLFTPESANSSAGRPPALRGDLVVLEAWRINGEVFCTSTFTNFLTRIPQILQLNTSFYAFFCAPWASSHSLSLIQLLFYFINTSFLKIFLILLIKQISLLYIRFIYCNNTFITLKTKFFKIKIQWFFNLSVRSLIFSELCFKIF